MAGVGPWVVYNDAKLNVHKKLIDYNSDAFKVALVLSTSNAIDRTMSPATYGALTNEVANGNGYPTGGVSAPSPTLSGGGAVPNIDFDTDDAVFTASGGTIVGRAAVLYDNTGGTKYLVAFCLLDSAPANYTISPGSPLTLQVLKVFSAR